jgi:hypothetical protein
VLARAGGGQAPDDGFEEFDLLLQGVADRPLQKVGNVRVDVSVLVAKCADGDGQRGLQLPEIPDHCLKLDPNRRSG